MPIAIGEHNSMKLLSNLAITHKLAAAFVSLILVMAGIGALNYQKLGFIEQSNGWTTHTSKVLEAMQTVMASMVDQETGLRGFLVANDPKFLEPYSSGHDAYERAFAEVKQLTADNAAQQARLDELSRFAQSWRKDVADHEITLMGKPETQAVARIMEASGSGRQSMDRIRAKVAEIDRVERDLLAARLEAETEAFATSRVVALIGGGLILALAVVLNWLLSRSIAKPIARMTSVMSRLAAGDTAVTVPEIGRGDEVGAMAGAVEVFKANAIERQRLEAEQLASGARMEADRRASMQAVAGRFETEVQGVVQAVSTGATQVEAAARSVAGSVEETGQQASAVAAASEQATANVQTVASAAEELAASISEVARQVTRSAAVARKASDAVGRTDSTVQVLTNSAERIGKVVGLISSIAGQTNLLALNATIEAARAGDAGKGFAVVASEVKNLASQTAKATEDISAQIGAMQEVSREVVEAIRGIGGIITEMDQVATTISTAVEQQRAATAEIARNVNEAAIGTQEVSSNIAGVSGAATASGSAASQVLTVAEDLSRQAVALRGAVDGFLSRVRTA